MPNPRNAGQVVSLSRIKKLLNRTYTSKFVRNVAVVATGTAGAQAITIAFSPVITRLYGPETFGLFGTFMAIVGVVTPIAALSYPIAIVLPKEDNDAKKIARLSAYIALGMATLVALVLLIAGKQIVELLQVQEISSFILLIPLVIVFAAWLQINQQWLIRKKQFRITARVAVLQSLLVNSAKAGIGLFKPLSSVLIVVYTLGSALHAFMLSIGVKNADEIQKKQIILPKASIWELAKKHYDFPLFRAPHVFINAISQSLPVLMLAAFSGPASAGFYALCKRMLDIPSQLIGQSVGDVFYPKINEAAHNGENLTAYIIKATLGLALVGFVPFGLLVIIGPWLFGFVFGQEWIVAGDYARWMALWFYSVFLNRPSVAAIATLSIQGFFLLLAIVGVAARLSALLIGFHFFESDLVAISLFSIVGVLINLFMVGVTLFKSKNFYVKR